MPTEAKKPVIFIAFANERVDQASYLRNLAEEARNIRGILEGAKSDGLCDFKEISNATLKEVLDVFQNPSYKDRIAIFHYAGHANSYQLMLESPEGHTTAAYARGLASFLGQQTGLELVFLNGCATQKQVQGLLDANVSAVISTSRAIDDGAATEFATRFYKGLAAGSSIRRAYNEAEAAMKTAHGDDSRSLYAREGSAIDQADDRVPLDRDRLPWDPGPSPGTDLAAQWVMATEFASRLYKGLVGGNDIQKAYNDARAAIQAAPQTARGSNTRNLYLAECKSIDMVDDRWPWDLRLRKGAEKADQWSLPNAVKDPLYGLPKIPEGDLPPSPFRHLSWFAREHAEVFFGRGQEIRELHQRVTDSHSAPIILFYGQSGVGKSSVLAAGLFPRLEASYEIHYVRRDSKKGLLGTVKEAISPEVDMTISESWLDQESRTGKPLIVMVDQVEEAFTRPNPDLPHELDEFWDALQAIFSDPAHRPKGKLILGFRKEWLAEIEKQLIDRKIPFSGLPLEPLKKEGIIESVNGPAKSERLRQKYRLEVEDGLAEIIADDLQEDRESAIAPAMQILLTKMWERARDTDHDHPVFDIILYQTLKKKGILLQDFLDQQLALLEEWNSESVNSGLALDFLAFHTTPLGTAEERTEEELQKNYRYQSQMVDPLVQQCVDLYLLERLSKAVATRLSHDTLAPLVRQRFATSDRPGQRAKRILESRSVDWRNEKEGAPLDESDLELVEQGKDGMRAWEPAEERLVVASRKERERKRKSRRNERIIKMAAVVAIIILAGLVFYGNVQANEKAEEALALYLASQSTQISADSASNYMTKVLLAVESLQHRKTANGDMALRSSIRLLTQPLAQLDNNGSVQAVAFSPDGSKVLTGSGDEKACIWDASSGEKLQELPHDGPVYAVAFNPDGSKVLTGSDDGKACIWDASSGEKLQELPHDGPVYAVAFSPDGSKVLTGSDDGKACIWEVSSGEKLQELPHDGSVWAVAFSPYGMEVLTGSYEKACIWDVSSGKKLQELPHDGPVRAVEFSPDGSKVLTGSGDGKACIWEVSSGEKLQELLHDDWVRAVDFSPDGSKVLTSSDDGKACIWEVSSGEKLHELPHDGWVWAVDFSPDGSKVLTSSDDGKACIWEVSSGEKLYELPHDGPVYAVAFSPDGSKVLTGSYDGKACIWDVSSGEKLYELLHDGSVRAVDFSSDGSKVLTGSDDGKARIWDVSSGEKLQELPHDDWVRAVDFSPDGSKVLTGSGDGKACIWEVSSGEKLQELPHDDWVRAVDFSPDGSKVLTGSGDGKACIWDASSGEKLQELPHDGPVYAVAFSPDGSKVLTGSDDGKACIWEVSSGEKLQELPHDGSVWAVAFSPYGTEVLTGSYEKACIWDVSSGKKLHELLHDGSVRAVDFSPDGSKVLTGSGDGKACIWEVSSGEKLHELPHDGSVWAVDFSPDGSKVLTGSSDGTPWIWPVSYEDLIEQACDCMAENLTIEDWQKYKITNVRTCPKEGSFNQSAFERLKNDPWGFLTGKPECEPCIAEAFRSRNL